MNCVLLWQSNPITGYLLF